MTLPPGPTGYPLRAEKVATWPLLEALFCPHTINQSRLSGAKWGPCLTR
jgi:hypothetical protein